MLSKWLIYSKTSPISHNLQNLTISKLRVHRGKRRNNKFKEWGWTRKETFTSWNTWKWSLGTRSWHFYSFSFYLSFFSLLILSTLLSSFLFSLSNFPLSSLHKLCVCCLVGLGSPFGSCYPILINSKYEENYY